MEALIAEVTRAPGPSLLIVAARLAGAAIVCGLIGLERELSDRSAGLRTNMLVGLAAATFAVVTEGVLMRADADVVRADPTRLIEAVTSGVAFLAAGIIVLARGEVRGLTTGASIWLSAAVGLSVGLGQWMVGFMAGFGGVFILFVVRKLERALGIKPRRRVPGHGGENG